MPSATKRMCSNGCCRAQAARVSTWRANGSDASHVVRPRDTRLRRAVVHLVHQAPQRLGVRQPVVEVVPEVRKKRCGDEAEDQERPRRLRNVDVPRRPQRREQRANRDANDALVEQHQRHAAQLAPPERRQPVPRRQLLQAQLAGVAQPHVPAVAKAALRGRRRGGACQAHDAAVRALCDSRAG